MLNTIYSRNKPRCPRQMVCGLKKSSVVYVVKSLRSRLIICGLEDFCVAQSSLCCLNKLLPQQTLFALVNSRWSP